MKTKHNYGPGSISENAKKRLEKLHPKSKDAKAIETRAQYEATEEGFTRGGGKNPQTKKK